MITTQHVKDTETLGQVQNRQVQQTLRQGESGGDIGESVKDGGIAVKDAIAKSKSKKTECVRRQGTEHVTASVRVTKMKAMT